MTEEAKDEPSGIWPAKLFGTDLPLSVRTDTHGSNLASVTLISFCFPKQTSRNDLIHKPKSRVAGISCCKILPYMDVLTARKGERRFLRFHST